MGQSNIGKHRRDLRIIALQNGEDRMRQQGGLGIQSSSIRVYWRHVPPASSAGRVGRRGSRPVHPSGGFRARGLRHAGVTGYTPKVRRAQSILSDLTLFDRDSFMIRIRVPESATEHSPRRPRMYSHSHTYNLEVNNSSHIRRAFSKLTRVPKSDASNPSNSMEAYPS